jgi:hypothetical protein
MSDSARKGKVATLPAKIREEVNRRLHDGEQARQILPWLNADKDVLRVLDELWHEEPVTAQNLSEWRRGGFQDWQRQREHIEKIKILADFSSKMAQASGGSLSQGAIAIAGGHIMEVLEKVLRGEKPTILNDEGEEVPVQLELKDVIESVATLSHAEVAHKRETRQGKALALDVQRFQRQTAELFIKFYEDRQAKEIAEGKGSKEVKMDKLVTLMFGEKPG